MNILEACQDANIFGHAFRQRESWQAWFAFLCALFGLKMDREQRAAFRECTQRDDRPREQAQEAWLVIGRRGGKSFILAVIAVFLASFRDWTGFLSPGERATIMIVAADRKQARVIIRYCKGLLHAVPLLKKTIEGERQESIDLTNRVTIEVHSCSFRTVRGFTIVAALCDEAAFWRTDDGTANPDHEVINAIRPAMATIPNGLLLVASSPYARRGELWEAYQQYFGKAGPVLVWQAPTTRMNPVVPRKIIDEAYAKDPASAAAEYGAEFRTDIESFVSREAVESCIVWGDVERPYDAANNYVAFTDPSGGSSDSFTLAIGHRAKDGLGVLDVLREVKPPFSPSSVVAEYAALLKSYSVTTVHGDRYAGSWPSEQFEKQGITYVPSERPKSQIYLDGLPLINSKRVSLLGNRRMFQQLIALERRTARGGKDSIDHPPGGHDDCANAAMGVLVHLGESTYDLDAMVSGLGRMCGGSGYFGQYQARTGHRLGPLG